ncbi:hypothetical protein [Paenibacillus sp. MMO-58]|uniref:hypothetical protein n=1 Tax=Paenibacillus sp. MMO-58 TaxID=3081290 RepID=UPI0030166B6A
MNLFFTAKAEKKERSFFRLYGKAGYTFYTIKENRPNTIQKVTPASIYITTEKGVRPIRISRKSMRKALSMLFYRRVTTLKALMKIHAFSSALAGLLKAIVSDICKVTETKTGAVRLSLRGLRYFFSGVSKGPDDIRIVKENGGTFVLLNYVNIRYDQSAQWKKHLRDLGLTYRCVMLDPGAKTIAEAEKRGRKLEPIDLDDYADFVKRHSDVIYQYLTCDVIGDPEKTRLNTLHLERVVGRRPVPIYHVQSPLEVLEQLVEEDHEVIAIGGSVFVGRKQREIMFAEIFERFGDQNFHALGLGTMRLLLQHRWFSSDSSSWLNGRIFRKLLAWSGDEPAAKGMSSEEALAFNIRSLTALEERYTDIQIHFNLIGPT